MDQKQEEKQIIDPSLLSGAFAINIAAGVVLTFLQTQKVVPFEVWGVITVLVLITYGFLKWSKNRMVSTRQRIILTTIFAIFFAFIFGGMSYLLNHKGDSLPISSSYWRWLNTDMLDSKDSKIADIRRLNKTAFEIYLDRPEEIRNKEIYYNIGYVMRTADTHWQLEVKQSDQFKDFIQGKTRITLNKGLFIRNEKIYIYLTNKPKKPGIINVTNYDRAFFHEIGTIENGGL